MLKAILEFIGTGIAVVVSYVIYFILAVVMTILIGLPIGVGIKLIYDTIASFFGGVF